MELAHLVTEALSKQTRQLHLAKLAILGGTHPMWAAPKYLTVVRITSVICCGRDFIKLFRFSKSVCKQL